MTPDEDEERERLLFHLENQTGFWFAMVVGDDVPSRARLREAVERWCRQEGRPFIVHNPEPDRLVLLAVELAKGDVPGIHWIRADGAAGLIESWNAGAAQMFLAMNERREAYRKRLDGAIIVEGRSSLKRLLRELAPDLFSIRALIAEPGADVGTPSGEAPKWLPPAGLASLSGMAPDAAQALLELDHLAGLGVKVGTGSWIGASFHVAMSLLNERRYDECEARALELLDQLGNAAVGVADPRRIPALLATLHAMVGTAAAEKGNHTDALPHFDRAFELSVSYEPSDQREHAAMTLQMLFLSKQKAMSLASSGDLETAREGFDLYLEGLKSVEKELSPELRLEIPVTSRDLASVLERQGKLDQAEAVLRAGLVLAERCAAESPDEGRWKLETVASGTALGRMLMIMGDATGAEAVLRPAINIAERLEAVESVKLGTGDVYVLLSLALLAQGDFSAAAFPIGERAVTWVQQQFKQAPGDVGAGWISARLEFNRACLFDTVGDNAGARDALRSAADLVARLPVRNAEDGEVRSLIQRLTRPARQRGGRRAST